MTENVPAVIEKGMTPYLRNFDDDEVRLIRTLLIPRMAPGASPQEVDEFIYRARKEGLDPFCKQIYLVPRDGRHVIEVSIDGLRLKAQRNKQYAGQLGPEWCGPDGKWVDVWTKKEPPTAARVAVLRHDFKAPLWSVALYDSYVQNKRDGTPNIFWKKSGPHMLAKCCEALSIRRACPNETSGLYIPEEMHNMEITEINFDPHADNSDVEIKEGQVVDTIPNTLEHRKKQDNAILATLDQQEDIAVLAGSMPSVFFLDLLKYVEIPDQTQPGQFTTDQATVLLDTYEKWYEQPLPKEVMTHLVRERLTLIKLVPETDEEQYKAFRAALLGKEKDFTVMDGIKLAKKHPLMLETFLIGRKCPLSTGELIDPTSDFLSDSLGTPDKANLLNIFLPRHKETLTRYRDVLIDALEPDSITDDQSLRDRAFGLKAQRAQKLAAAEEATQQVVATV